MFPPSHSISMSHIGPVPILWRPSVSSVDTLSTRRCPLRVDQSQPTSSGPPVSAIGYLLVAHEKCCHDDKGTRDHFTVLGRGALVHWLSPGWVYAAGLRGAALSTILVFPVAPRVSVPTVRSGVQTATHHTLFLRLCQQRNSGVAASHKPCNRA